MELDANLLHMGATACILMQIPFPWECDVRIITESFLKALLRDTSNKAQREGVGQVWPSLRTKMAGRNVYSHHGWVWGRG